MKKLIFIFFVVFNSCNYQTESPQKLTNIAVPSPTFDFLPTSTTNQIIKHKAYTLSYSEAHEQAEWVAYELSNATYENRDFTRPYFIDDPYVKTYSADWKNYKNSGYDKGHLCPAGDRKSSYELYKETFYTSNISPQKSKFNAGIWNRLEQKVRYWANKYNGLYIVTAGVLSNDLDVIGRENVSVPKYFYKVLLTKDQKKAIAFLVPHKETNQPLYTFVVSIDELEKLTKIDFFYKLPDATENALEKNKDYKNWSF